MYHFGSNDDNKLINNNSNIIFVLFVFHYFIIFLLYYKYTFYENQQNGIINKLELLNKKYVCYNNCVEKLIIISNDALIQINTLNIRIENIKKNEKLLKKQISNMEECLKIEINDKVKINILEDKLNNEIEKINILEETLNFENGKINLIEEKLNNEIEKINIAIKINKTK